ncbi:beta-1,6-N-acetylglucosaminyltransferase [Bacillus sp. USDA818B3_A]|uniref:beta-1,6-N-acetylglucosaminyltransferase n=1 Tax=Bacillus sp. USDA818B3_A TaxID=2698834 RepID=UPI00136DE3DD|nr:beta-1,6-N-acetylglucosaminyltransferase [Bacillus sp. USDA818B3_A]
MSSKIARTAYILVIHKNPEQVNKFVKQLISKEYTDVYIHIDQKNPQLKAKMIKSPRVKVLNKSVAVRWGDITLVDATLLLLKEVIASGISYDFICFRSGQDMLVKKGFAEFLAENKNKIFMNAYRVQKREPHAAFVSVNWPEWSRQLYITPYHPYRLMRRGIAILYSMGVNISPNKYKLPENFSIYNGSNWFCIPLEVAKYIIKFVNKNEWYYEVFRNSLVPDEFFFQTLIMNSKYKNDVVNNNLMYIKFGKTVKTRNNPITLKMDNVETIKNSNEFFARKFDESVDNQVIDYYCKKISM